MSCTLQLLLSCKWWQIGQIYYCHKYNFKHLPSDGLFEFVDLWPYFDLFLKNLQSNINGATTAIVYSRFASTLTAPAMELLLLDVCKDNSMLSIFIFIYLFVLYNIYNLFIFFIDQYAFIFIFFYLLTCKQLY